MRQHAKRALVATIGCVASIAACTSYNDNGELVRRHIGYVEVVTPSVESGETPVQTLEIRTIGVWFDIDRRRHDQALGSGVGIGYRHDRRDIVPADCHVIVRLETRAQMEEFASILKQIEIREGGICIIRDTDI
jgi:hypothetical protein